MITIWKYPLTLGVQSLDIPRGGKPLCVQVQRGVPTIWALVDTEMPCVPFPVWVIATGEPIVRTTQEYLGTVQLDEGLVVFHVFIER